MGNVLAGFATIAAVIALGAALAHIGLVDRTDERTLSRLAFFVASPALLLTTVGDADVHALFTRSLLATVVGVVVPVVVYTLAARRIWRRGLGDTVIGALASSYVNAGNLGLPVAAYVLGSTAFIAPTLLLQLLVMQPLALTLLDAERRGRRPGWTDILRTPLTNPLTLATLIGVVLAVTGTQLPRFIHEPVSLVGGMAVPGMLLAYGIALRLGPGLGGGIPLSELATTWTLKMLVQPLSAYAVARFGLGLTGPTLLAVVICSTLPTAQNIFVHATRFDRATVLARDTILLTTVSAMPLMLLEVLLLG